MLGKNVHQNAREVTPNLKPRELEFYRNMRPDPNRVLSVARQARVKFILVEIDSGIAFTGMPHPSAKARARAAYRAVLHSLKCTRLPQAEHQKVLDALQPLEERLEQMGEMV